jgi:phage tail-like protein
MPQGHPDPYGAFNFQVVIQGIMDDGSAAKAGFMEVSGLEIDVQVIEYRTGGEPASVRKLPGLHKYPNIVLKRGITSDLTLWNWMKTVTDGQPLRADGSIILLDEARQTVLRWNFRRGFPCKIVGPTLNAKSSEVAIETLEIAHEGLTIEGA